MSVRAVVCNSWEEILAHALAGVREVRSTWDSPSAVPFFRGHSSTDHRLVPGLFRSIDGLHHTMYDEQNLYYEFRGRGASLCAGMDEWETLFLMQHHGVPTRLLDWTESLGAALYFALRDCTGAVDLWMLDPYSLNAHALRSEKVPDPTEILDVHVDLEGTYVDYFVEPRCVPEWNGAIAIYPRRNHARLASQSGVFTLHADPVPLEDTGASFLRKFTLSEEATAGALDMLRVVGFNEYSLFPDADGLARFLRDRFPPQNVEMLGLTGRHA